MAQRLPFIIFFGYLASIPYPKEELEPRNRGPGNAGLVAFITLLVRTQKRKHGFKGQKTTLETMPGKSGWAPGFRRRPLHYTMFTWVVWIYILWEMAFPFSLLSHSR